MSKSVTFSRERLYELVWSQPISRIGPRYGVSDTAIAKICRKLDVPSHREAIGLGWPTGTPSISDHSRI